MKLTINGKNQDFAGNDLSALLQALKIDAAVVVVEKNGEIIPRNQNCALNNGDQLEIVRFVGGG